MVMHLMKRPEHEVAHLADAILKLKTSLKLCKECDNVCDAEICAVCSSHNRKNGQLCVVEDFADQMSVESTAQYQGKYHILGGLIAPIEGIGPAELNIESLIQRVSTGEFKEVILALSATVEGDTTMFYIARRLREFPVKITSIARGIAVGGELEYADEITLGRSLLNRVEYKV